MPSFRGEMADARHLSQFIHIEAEIPGALDDVIEAVEENIRFIVAGLLAEHADEIAKIVGSLAHIEEVAGGRAFTRLTFDEAAAVLKDDPSFIRDHGAWRTLTHAGERRLIEVFDDFIWVTRMDHLAVPYYQAFEAGGLHVARNGDLLFGIGETVGAGERHMTGADVCRALALHGVPEGDYEWYRTLKDRHPLQTAGFGMGLERFLLWVLRHDDIRDIPLVLRMNGQDIMP